MMSLKKSEVFYQLSPREVNSPPQIRIDGTKRNAVEHFTYLGSVISNDATVSKDLDNRLSNTAVPSEDCQRVWHNNSFRLSTKIQAHRTVAVPTLLYGAETWVLYRKQIRLPERFRKRCLRSILASNGKTTCHTKKTSRDPACPA